jgi:hypothetical protein
MFYSILGDLPAVGSESLGWCCPKIKQAAFKIIMAQIFI